MGMPSIATGLAAPSGGVPPLDPPDVPLLPLAPAVPPLAWPAPLPPLALAPLAPDEPPDPLPPVAELAPVPEGPSLGPVTVPVQATVAMTSGPSATARKFAGQSG